MTNKPLDTLPLDDYILHSTISSTLTESNQPAWLQLSDENYGESNGAHDDAYISHLLSSIKCAKHYPC